MAVKGGGIDTGRRGTMIPTGARRRRGTSVDRIDPRIWYAVAAVVVVLLLAWLLGWFGGAEAPPPAPAAPG